MPIPLHNSYMELFEQILTISIIEQRKSFQMILSKLEYFQIRETVIFRISFQKWVCGFGGVSW